MEHSVAVNIMIYEMIMIFSPGFTAQMVTLFWQLSIIIPAWTASITKNLSHFNWVQWKISKVSN